MGEGQTKPPCHRKHWQNLAVRRSRTPIRKFLGFFREFSGKFRGFFGIFGEFSALIMIKA